MFLKRKGQQTGTSKINLFGYRFLTMLRLRTKGQHDQGFFNW